MNVSTKVFSAPPDAPDFPDVGDMWIDPTTYQFYVYDGVVWIPYTDDIMKGTCTNSTISEPEDTPEQAYDRAMGVLK